jgi:hypothetical protein
MLLPFRAAAEAGAGPVDEIGADDAETLPAVGPRARRVLGAMTHQPTIEGLPLLRKSDLPFKKPGDDDKKR